jgi:DNA-binding CsgD family transcriptional regulator
MSVRLTGTFELDETAEAVYLTIAENPGADTAKIAELAERGEPPTQHILDNLAALELVTRDALSHGWTVMQADIGLATLLAHQEADLAQHQQQVENIRMRAARFLAARGHRKRSDPAGIEWITGSPEISSRAAGLAADCQDECLSLRPASGLSGTALGSSPGIDADILARSVESRSIILDSARNNKLTMESLRLEARAGTEVRTLPTLPARMRIFDRRYAMVSVSNISGIPAALAVNCEAVIDSFVMLFWQLWTEAEPLKESRPRRQGKMSPQETHVLKLWAQGHTDASAAHRMDVSLRTVRRLSDRLTERLGARSRFQLGATAIAQKLIDPVDML